MSEYRTFLSFCRDCLKTSERIETYCSACNSSRISYHDEIDSLAIAHIDCDAFYASIEKRDNPELEDHPVIIGGGKRGVVATACYIARTYGIHSAMPMFKALQACPEAIVIKPDMKKYVAASKQIRDLMETLTPLVAPLSIDEAFLDLNGTERVHGAVPAVILCELQNKITREVGVTVSIGLSHNKFLAKIASDFDKPNGFFMIGKKETTEFLAQQRINLIWGVGKVTSKKLEKDGLTHISQLQQIDESTLGKRYGELGLRLFRLSRGEDVRPVAPKRVTKSISSETTFPKDVNDIQWIEDRLWMLCETISKRMKKSNNVGRVVTLKLKTSNFKTLTRRVTLEEPSNLARIAFQTSKPLLWEYNNGPAFRLVGISFSDLTHQTEHAQSGLFEDAHTSIARKEQVIDKIREKFGDGAIGAGRSFKGPKLK